MSSLIIAPGESLGPSNTKLDLFVCVGDDLVDPDSLEWSIYDLTDPNNPSLIEGPVALDMVANRLALGHYFATWEAPESINLVDHEIRWSIKLTPDSAPVVVAQQFSVLAVSGKFESTPANAASFLARFPAFSEVSPSVVQWAIKEAVRCIDCECFGDKYNDAVNYMAAHLLEMTTGERAKGIQTVKFTTAQVSFFATQMASGDTSGLSTTPYGMLLMGLQRAACGVAMRVLCG